MFQREMAERSERGSPTPGITLPSISAYLKDATTPPVEFLLEAAAVLGVRAAWLMTGEEPAWPPTLPPDQNPLHAAMLGQLGWLRLSPALEARALEVLTVFHAARVHMYETAGWSAPEPVDSAHVFHDIIAAPRRAFARDPAHPLEIQWWRSQEQVEASLHAIAITVPDGLASYWIEGGQQGDGNSRESEA
jgi:hypothetical protein